MDGIDKGFVVGLLVAVITGVSMWVHYKGRIASFGDALTETLVENAKLRVAIDAAGKTEEARKVCAMTLAALHAAYPDEPYFASIVAKKKEARE